MRVGFAGTPDFARQALRAIAEAGFQVPLVLTQPDRPAGRGLKLQPSPVKQLATSLKLPLQQPRGLRLDGRFGDDALGAQRALHDAALDVLVVAAYGLILPPWVLALPERGCLNIHGSLLPRWRGAAPIQRAIEAGDAQTGITIMQMDAGLDTGPMLCSQALPILDDDTTATLHDRLASLGAGLMVEALQHIDSVVPTPQPEAGANYAAKIDKAEALIDWAAPAALIERRIRAFDPFPGCHFMLHGETVKVWRAELVDRSAEPGRVLAAHGELVVACGAQALSLRTLQRTGGRRVAVGDFLHGHAVAAGTRL